MIDNGCSGNIKVVKKKKSVSAGGHTDFENNTTAERPKQAAVTLLEAKPVAGAENAILRVKIWRLQSIIHETENLASRLLFFSLSFLSLFSVFNELQSTVNAWPSLKTKVSISGVLDNYLNYLFTFSYPQSLHFQLFD